MPQLLWPGQPGSPGAIEQPAKFDNHPAVAYPCVVTGSWVHDARTVAAETDVFHITCRVNITCRTAQFVCLHNREPITNRFMSLRCGPESGTRAALHHHPNLDPIKLI
jgi:hypothetical protein